MRGGSKFDRGIVAFMHCVLQLQNHLTLLSAARRPFSPPYTIEGAIFIFTATLRLNYRMSVPLTLSSQATASRACG